MNFRVRSPRPRGLFGPLLELIARRVRAEVESELANFNLRPRHVIALTVRTVARTATRAGWPATSSAMVITSR